MTRVAVSGALGRMGRLARRVIEAAPDLQFAGGFARTRDSGDLIYDDLAQLLERERPDVVIDFTPRPASQNVASTAVQRGIAVVVGSSEWNRGEREQLRAVCETARSVALIVPNFAIGAVIMMRFAQEAAKFFQGAEIIEMHHADKRDKPSGTAAATAERIAAGGFDHDVAIHSVRLPGLVSHQEVLFGNPGEALTIRHDSLSYDSFANGIAAAIRGVGGLAAGLHVGLECVL